MKKKTCEKAVSSLHLRMRPSVKEKLIAKAKELDCSLTDYVLACINNEANGSGINKNGIIKPLLRLSAQVHRIGININQVVHLMHLETRNGSTAPSLDNFNQLLSGYQAILKSIKSQFEKIITHEQAGL